MSSSSGFTFSAIPGAWRITTVTRWWTVIRFRLFTLGWWWGWLILFGSLLIRKGLELLILLFNNFLLLLFLFTLGFDFKLVFTFDGLYLALFSLAFRLFVKRVAALESPT